MESTRDRIKKARERKKTVENKDNNNVEPMENIVQNKGINKSIKLRCQNRSERKTRATGWYSKNQVALEKVN